MKSKLSDVCFYVKDRIDVSVLNINNYISTENMLPDKAGIRPSAGLPSTKSVSAFQEGDVLISNIRPYFKKIWYAQFSGGCSNDILVLRANDRVLPHYLYYLLSDDKFFEYATATAKGTKMPRGDKQAIMNYEIKVQSLEYQANVVSILSSIDSKILLNGELNHHLQQIAQTFFKFLFVENASDGWTFVDLGAVTTEIRTKVKEQQLPVLSAVKTGNLVLSEDYFTKQVYSKDIGKYIVVEPNDFAYNPARINIGSIGINRFNSSGCVSPVYVVFRTEPEYHYFFDFFLKSPNFQEEVRVRASGSVRQSLNYGDFALIQVLYPPLDDVRKFNYQYKSIHSTIHCLDAENLRLAEIRETLLPQLMSGELSVTDISETK